MSRIVSIICFVAIAVSGALCCDASVSAHSAVAIDADTGTVLYENNKDAHLPIASTTKIMTCLIACESGKLADKVRITSQMLDGAEGTMLYLKPGDVVSLYDLVCGAMLASGNDAAQSIAVYLSGSEARFANRMNRRAIKIGMNDTEFVSASGLDKGAHHSSAYDMALLAATAVANKQFASICKQQSAYITINDSKQKIFNHNKLLTYDSQFIGVKTGFTQRAGRCLVSAYKYKNSTIIIVTLNDANDWNDHRSLVQYAMTQYTIQSDTLHFDIDVVGGIKESVRCTSRYDLAVLSDIRVTSFYYPIAYASVKKGDAMGRTYVYCDDVLIATVEITAEEDIESNA